MGTRIRHIQTEIKLVRGVSTTVPVLDGDGRDIELWSIEIPPEIEAENGISPEIDQTDPVAIDAFIQGERKRIADARAAKAAPVQPAAPTPSEE